MILLITDPFAHGYSPRNTYVYTGAPSPASALYSSGECLFQSPMSAALLNRSCGLGRPSDMKLASRTICSNYVYGFFVFANISIC